MKRGYFLLCQKILFSDHTQEPRGFQAMNPWFLIIALLIILPAVSAANTINLKIEKTTINEVIVSEFNNPATFDLKITNLGSGGDFQIFSLIGVDMAPKGTFQLASGETKNVQVQVYALDNLRKKTGVTTFVYKIYNPVQGSQEDTLIINILPISEALKISIPSITPNATEAIILINNRVNSGFDVEADFSSAFFDSSQKFNLKPLEKKELAVKLDKEKMKTLIAGHYILTADFLIQDKKYRVTGPIEFTEQEGISVKESVSGFFFRKQEIEKTNSGNIPILVTTNIKKNIISRLLTTFNLGPTQVTRKGVFIYYIFQKEINPGESFKVGAVTSWIYPLILLALILIIAFLVYMYTRTDISLKKRVAFVRTKTGEFALKIYLTVRARKYVEKIEINEKLPALVKIYEKFLIPPQKIDHKRHRISWRLESLHPGEERVFSYIVYSKVFVVGKFQLPAASAVYEREGKIKEAFSNRTSFLNEPMRGIEYKGE